MNRVAVSELNDGEAPVIVGLSDAAMHMYAAAIRYRTPQAAAG
jgi:hypothetical protein